MMVAPNGLYVHQALDRFLETREGARRFHDDEIGKGIDPNQCFADWLALARRHDTDTIIKRYWSKVDKSAMNEFSGTAGGYLVPPDLAVGMMRDLSTGSLWRRWGAYVHPMKTMTCALPLPDVSTAPSASGIAPYFGGFQMSFLAEGNTFPSTAGMKFRQLNLTARELSGYVYASNPFLQDAEGVDVWLRRLFANGAAWYQDWFFFNGLGVGSPLGVINAPGSITVTRSSSGPLVADAQAMLNKLLPSAWDSGAVWFCHPTVLSKITAFTGWFPNGELILYGLPVVPTGKCATSGTIGDFILAAPSLYVIGDRMQFEIVFAPEEQTGFPSNQTAIRIFSRVDGQPALSQAITLSDASSTCSPFVVLK